MVLILDLLRLKLLQRCLLFEPIEFINKPI